MHTPPQLTNEHFPVIGSGNLGKNLSTARNQAGGSMVPQSNGTVTQTAGRIDSLKTGAKENKNWANLFQGSPMGSKGMDLKFFSPII